MSERRLALLVLLSVCLLAITLGVASAWRSYESSRAQPPIVVASTHCHSVNGLPDSICTPGVADPRVTQDNISTTICARGYTKTVRPPASYTQDLKARQIAEYGYADTSLADYEEDHLIPLELGGHPTDPKNLWPQPRSGSHPASLKDLVENSLHTKVCAGVMTLAAAQAAIALNWESI
ncbi:MAG TPA: hypothetical protein VHJ99_00380 [Candidatus Dormibacteraeota bacterium]|nr:hypothetical protein [Candidatus Dormibacteraeota bacterium]